MTCQGLIEEFLNNFKSRIVSLPANQINYRLLLQKLMTMLYKDSLKNISRTGALYWLLGLIITLSSCNVGGPSLDVLDDKDQALLSNEQRGNKVHRVGQFFVHKKLSYSMDFITSLLIRK